MSPWVFVVLLLIFGAFLFFFAGTIEAFVLRGEENEIGSFHRVMRVMFGPPSVRCLFGGVLLLVSGGLLALFLLFFVKS